MPRANPSELTKYQILNHLPTCFFIQLQNYLRFRIAKFIFQSRRIQLYEKRSSFDIQIACVAGDHFTGNLRPGFDDARLAKLPLKMIMLEQFFDHLPY